MIKLLRIAGVILILAMWPLVMAGAAMATDQPDSTPTITNIKANINLIKTGDVLIYGEYDIPHADLPDEGADQSYNFSLIDTDGSTILGTVLPYVLFDHGYNEGAWGFYFDADDSLTVNQTYTIRISQNPAYFSDPEVFNYDMSLSAWTTKSSQEDNQIEMAINIITMATRLETSHDDYTLLESSAGGTVLSDPTGETYFRGAIYSIQLMAPSLFLVQVLSYNNEDRLWTFDQFDEYQGRFTDTWVGGSTDNVSAEFGFTPQSFMALIYLLPISIGVIIVSSIKFKRAEPGYLITTAMLLCTVFMGWFSIPLFAIIFQLLAIYIGYLWFYARG